MIGNWSAGVRKFIILVVEQVPHSIILLIAIERLAARSAIFVFGVPTEVTQNAEAF
jgi:hypothetical protein